METLRFQKTVDAAGSVTLSMLPPGKAVDIIVLLNEENDLRSDMRRLMDKVKSRQQLAGLSKAEIIRKLREDREKAWEERHGG